MISSPYDVFLAGTVAGGTEITTTIPLEMIKTQMQLHPTKYNGMLHAGKSIVKTHGIKSLYSGLPVLLTQVSAKVGFRFTIFDQFKKRLRDKDGNLSNTNKIISGFGTGLLEGTLITTPTERIKVLQQNQLENRTSKKSGLQIARTIIKNDGITTLWKGLGPTVTRQCVNTGARLSLYDFVRGNVERILPKKFNDKVGIVSGATVGFIGSFLTQPVDVVKSYTQANNDGVLANMKRINKLGVIGFYQGLRPRLFRMTLSQAITFGTYEYVYNLISNSKK